MIEKYEDHEFPKEEDFIDDLGKAPPITNQFNPAEVGIIKELSPFKTLTRIRENLRGYFWSEEDKEYQKVEGFEPLMNDKGINKFLAILSSFLNDTITMSNIPPEEVNKLVEHICDEVIPIMHIHYKEWGIKTKGDLGILDSQIFMMAYGAIHKASGAGDRAVIRGFSRLNPFARM